MSNYDEPHYNYNREIIITQPNKNKPAHIVNQVCGSGLRSVVSAYQSIQLGENKIVIAGGQENMSRATHAIFYREDKKFSENKLVDTMINDGLIDAFNDYHMGVTAENVAEKFKISREEQDLCYESKH